MTLATSCPSTTEKFAMLFLLGYPFLLWVLTRGGNRGPVAASIVPAALVPLYVGAAASWVVVVSTLQGRALAGGGRHSTAAGFAEALGMLMFSGLIATFVCAVIWSADRFSSRDDHTSYPPVSRRVRMFAIALAAVPALNVVAQLVTVREIVNGIGVPSITLQQAMLPAVMMGACAAISFAWLFLSRSRASLRLDQHRSAIAAACTLGAALISLAAWHYAKVYQLIAVGG